MNIKTLGFTALFGAVTVLAGPHAHAQLAPLPQTSPPTSADKLASDSVAAGLAGDHDKSLRLAEEAIKSDPKNPWAHLDRAGALRALHRPDDAIAAFREAERRYSEAELWGRSVAIWGQADVLSQLGRCQEAAPVFERYATFVEKVDNAAAALARQYAKQCAARPAAR